MYDYCIKRRHYAVCYIAIVSSLLILSAYICRHDESDRSKHESNRLHYFYLFFVFRYRRKTCREQ